MPNPTHLYRHYDNAGVLLYVGISLDAVSRLNAHMRTSRWSGEIARIEVELFASRGAALDAERLAIVNESPLHNIVHNKTNRTKLASRLTAEIVKKRPTSRPRPIERPSFDEKLKKLKPPITYRPPAADGDRWLSAGEICELTGLSGAWSYFEPGVQRVDWLKDGRPQRGHLFCLMSVVREEVAIREAKKERARIRSMRRTA